MAKKFRSSIVQSEFPPLYVPSPLITPVMIKKWWYLDVADFFIGLWMKIRGKKPSDLAKPKIEVKAEVEKE